MKTLDPRATKPPARKLSHWLTAVCLAACWLGCSACGSDAVGSGDADGLQDSSDIGIAADSGATDSVEDTADSGATDAHDATSKADSTERLDTAPEFDAVPDVAPDAAPDAAPDTMQSDSTPADTDTAADTADTDAAADTADTDAAADADTLSPADTAADTDTSLAPLFDHEAIADPSTANCQFFDPHQTVKDGVVINVWRVSYTSWESIAGTLQPILIRGYLARPAEVSALLPGVVHAHGLGGFSTEASATGPAALIGAAVLAYTGPGGGDSPDNTSEGLPSGYDGGYRMFDTLDDPRGSWFWGHAVAAMRGLTCLQQHVGVDPERLGITGYSAGGVATLVTASVDPRVDAAVALSGTGAWGIATQSPQAWQHALLQGAELDTASPEWLTLLQTVEPYALVGGATAPVWIVNGTSDEFFPMTSHAATFSALSSTFKRQSFAGNYDHGCYAITGGESAATIEARASLRATGAQRALFRHAFGTDSTYAQLPKAPTASATAAGAVTLVQVNVDDSVGAFDVVEVKYWWSNDDAFLWGNVALDKQAPGVWAGIVAAPLQANSVWFADVEYDAGDFFFEERFSVSSEPVIPPGFVPHIRGIDSCL